MINEINDLKEKFKNIKDKELTQSLRKGTTGLGYTFENLLDKKEDNLSLPDYKGIEIKTKLGYTKTPLTLFCLTPTNENNNAIKYLYENYGYPDPKNTNFKNLKFDVYLNKNNIVANRYLVKLNIDELNNKLILSITDKNFTFKDTSLFWDLNEIENRLKVKLNTLAIIKGFPYKHNNTTYYKYTNLNIYKLKTFDNFINLLKDNQIYITFNISTFNNEFKYGQIHDRGTAFKLKLDNINILFEKIY